MATGLDNLYFPMAIRQLVLIVMVVHFGGSLTLRATPSQEAARVFSEFKGLKPPFGAAAAQRAFRGDDWIDTAEIHHVTMLLGATFVSMDRGGEVFDIRPVRGGGLPQDWSLEIRTTKNLNSEKALRNFLHGKAPWRARVVEYFCEVNGKIVRAGAENRTSD